MKAESGATALYAASIDGHDSVVVKLLAAGAQVNLQSKDGVTAVSLASMVSHDLMVAKLLAAGAQVNLQDKDGRTALVFASQSRMVTTRRWLCFSMRVQMSIA